MSLSRNVFRVGAALLACLIAVSQAESVTKPPCPCTFEYNPVCGTDGITYPTECVAKCKGATVAYPGECDLTIPSTPPPPADCQCTREWNPQCGSDGVTYGNPCMAKCWKAEPTTPGPCKKEK